MKIKIYKKENNWHSKLLRGNGGVNSLIVGSISNTFFGAIKIFTFRNLINAMEIKKISVFIGVWYLLTIVFIFGFSILITYLIYNTI